MLPTKAHAYISRNRAQPGAGQSDFSVERYRHAAAFVPATSRAVLDAGCNIGCGAPALRAAAPHARLVGVDIVPERVIEARRQFDEVHEALITKLPLKDASVDALTALEVIEHLTDQDVHQFLMEARRVLTCGGRLILTTPNPRYVRLWLTRRSVLDDPAHVSQFAAGALSALLKGAGFRIRCIEGTGRVTRYLGRRVPMLWMYGSYLAVGERL